MERDVAPITLYVMLKVMGSYGQLWAAMGCHEIPELKLYSIRVGQAALVGINKWPTQPITTPFQPFQLRLRTPVHQAPLMHWVCVPCKSVPLPSVVSSTCWSSHRRHRVNHVHWCLLRWISSITKALSKPLLWCQSAPLVAVLPMSR